MHSERGSCHRKIRDNDRGIERHLKVVEGIEILEFGNLVELLIYPCASWITNINRKWLSWCSFWPLDMILVGFGQQLERNCWDYRLISAGMIQRTGIYKFLNWHMIIPPWFTIVLRLLNDNVKGDLKFNTYFIDKVNDLFQLWLTSLSWTFIVGQISCDQWSWNTSTYLWINILTTKSIKSVWF